jgi:hypothetical protein
MKINKISISQFVLLVLFLLINGKSFGQLSNEGLDNFNVKNCLEKLYLNTDRDIYFTGEMVWLKVYKLSSLTNSPYDLSKVVYVELLDSLNNPVNQVKILVNGTSGSSEFRLSDTLSTGNYLIRAYTKWMLNYSEDLFFYKTLTIINPFKNVDQIMIPARGKNHDAGNSHVEGVLEVIRPTNNENGTGINIKVEPFKDKYLSRDRVNLNLLVTDMAGHPVEADLSISVVKPSLVNADRWNLLNDSGNIPETSSRKPGDTFPGRNKMGKGNDQDTLKRNTETFPAHLPEIEGPLISGVVKNKTTNEPVKNTDISLSFVGKAARCQFVKTNDKGEFNFVIKDQYGMDELVIQPLSHDISDSYIELSQSFSNTFNKNKPGVFSLDSSRAESINKAIISMQINNIYEPFRQKAHMVEIKNEVNDFYGNPDRRINMSDYIELKNVREIVKEILPNIMVIKRKGKYNFKIINSYPYPPFENPPLTLVDGVPVYDIENLLNVASKDIERIDIINRRYFYSDQIFDGILSFFTKKKDLSVLEFDESVFRQAIEICQLPKDFYSPDYSIDSLKKSHIPDFRNSLYWKPDLKSTKEGKASVEFFTSDEPGIYTVIIEGISASGKTGIYSIPLVVK